MADEAPRPPFPIGWALLVAFIASARHVAAGGDAQGFVLICLLTVAVMGCIYLYRLRRLHEPKYKWLRDRLAEEDHARRRRGR